jgi:hypothetical protein
VSWPLYQVDAFTDEPFAGNPAAVCLLEADADPAWMQRVAAEMNLSETAFLRLSTGRYGLRWFTPTVEVELCGHATLASAHVLFSEDLVQAGQPVRFDSASGPLTARPGADGAMRLGSRGVIVTAAASGTGAGGYDPLRAGAVLGRAAGPGRADRLPGVGPGRPGPGPPAGRPGPARRPGRHRPARPAHSRLTPRVTVAAASRSAPR